MVLGMEQDSDRSLFLGIAGLQSEWLGLAGACVDDGHTAEWISQIWRYFNFLALRAITSYCSVLQKNNLQSIDLREYSLILGWIIWKPTIL